MAKPSHTGAMAHEVADAATVQDRGRKADGPTARLRKRRPPRQTASAANPARRLVEEPTDRDAPIDHRPEVGARLILDVVDFTPTGEGLARLGGYVLFLRGAIPGERVEVEVTESKRRYGRARLLRVLRRSPERVLPRCRHFGECGRCSLQHLAYPAQLEMKVELLRKVLAHELPGVPIPLQPMIGMDDPWATRNKAHFVLAPGAEGPVLGHFKAHTQEVIAIEECPVHHEAANRAARALVASLRRHRVPAFHPDTQRGIARHVVVRASSHTGTALPMLVATHDRFAGYDTIGPETMAADGCVAGVALNENPQPGPVVLGSYSQPLAGADRLIEVVAGIQFFVSPTSFFQTNPLAAGKLVETVLAYALESPTNVMDLYAGVGLFSLPLARMGHQVTAVEQNAQAVADARAAAELNGITGCSFHHDKSETLLKRLARQNRFDLVVLDPPRDGCPEWMLRLLAQRFRPKRIVDVSCEPKSLARELRTLLPLGYRLVVLQPIDMFPHTAQIESVAVLDRIGERRRPSPA